MNKEELLKMAHDAGFEHFASAEAEWMDCSIDDLVSFANAILERAAVECFKLDAECDKYPADCAVAIRALKTQGE